MSSIQSHRQGDVLTLIFSRPESGNAFGLDDAKALQKILRANRSARILIWRSRGRFFCAGGDLGAYARLTKRAQGLLVNRKIAASLSELAGFPGVTLAVVEGDCLGGGMELLSCFDVVWAAPHVAFGLWQRRLGLSFGWGGGRRLAARLGIGRLKERALAGESFTAFRAYDLGLVDRVLSCESVQAELGRFSQRQLLLAMEPVVAIKTLTPASEAHAFRRLWGNPFHIKILSNFRRHAGRRPQ